MTFQRWKELWRELVMKYNDGYINNVNESNGRTPKGVSYGDKFLKEVVKERPGYYNVQWKDKK